MSYNSNVIERIVFLILLIISFASFGCETAEVGARVGIIVRNDELFVYVENTSNKTISLAGNFEVGGKDSISPVSLMILDSSGNAHKVNGIIDSVNIRSEIMLQRNHLYGRRFSFESIRTYFELNHGNYKVKAKYHDVLVSMNGASCDKLVEAESEWVDIEF